VTNEIQQTRYDHLMRRIGGIIGPGSKVSEVLTELFPTLDVENGPGELLFLTGWQLGFGGGRATGAAAGFQKFQVVNPADSGKIVVVTKLVAATNATSGYDLNVTDTLFTSAPGSQTKRDTREGIGATTTEVREDGTATPTSANFSWEIPARTPFQLEDPNGIAVLTPGFALEVGQTVVNLLMAVGFFWRERVAELSELNF